MICLQIPLQPGGAQQRHPNLGHCWQHIPLYTSSISAQFQLVETLIPTSPVWDSGVTVTVRSAPTKLFKTVISLINIPNASCLGVFFLFLMALSPSHFFILAVLFWLFFGHFQLSYYLIVCCLSPHTRSKFHRAGICISLSTDASQSPRTVPGLRQVFNTYMLNEYVRLLHLNFLGRNSFRGSHWLIVLTSVLHSFTLSS